MSFSAIGSFCSSLCKSCSVSYKNRVIIVGDVNPQNMEAVQNLFNRAVSENRVENQASPVESSSDLEQAVIRSRREVHPIDLHTVSVRDSDLPDIEESGQKIRYVAFKVALEALDKFSSIIELTHKEGWARCRAAQYLTELELLPNSFDLQDRFNRKLPIYEREYYIFQNKIEIVKKFGSIAASLWHNLKLLKVKDKYDLLRIKEVGLINTSQVEILEKGFTNYGSRALLEKTYFAQIGPQFQAIFIKAAEHFESHFLLKEEQSYTAWTFENTSDQSRTPLSRRRPFISVQAKESEIREIDFKEVKFHKENSELERLIEEFKVNSDLIPPEKMEGFSILRIQILCHLNNINIKKVTEMSLEKSLNRKEIQRIRDGLPRLNELQGTMQHVYHCIRRTMLPSELKSQHGFTTAALTCYKWENSYHKDFVTDLNASVSMVFLKVYALAILFRIASKFSPRQIEELNQTYEIGNWFSTDKKIVQLERTPSSGGENSEDNLQSPRSMILPTTHPSYPTPYLNYSPYSNATPRHEYEKGFGRDEISDYSDRGRRNSGDGPWFAIDPHRRSVLQPPLPVYPYHGHYELPSPSYKRQEPPHPVISRLISKELAKEPKSPPPSPNPSPQEPKAFLVTVHPSEKGPPTTETVSIPYTLSTSIPGVSDVKSGGGVSKQAHSASP